MVIVRGENGTLMERYVWNVRMFMEKGMMIVHVGDSMDERYKKIEIVNILFIQA
jgi:hypothetical protein